MSLRHTRRHHLAPLRRISRNSTLVLWLGSLIVGIAAGYGAIGVRLGIQNVQELLYGFADERFHSRAMAVDW